MRRWTAVALVVGLSGGLAACGGGTPEEATGQPAAATTTTTPSPTLDQRLATIAAAQADLVTIIQQRTNSSAQVLAAIADLNTRIDGLQREVDALAADTAATTTRTSTAMNDLAAGLRDVRGAVDAVARSLPAANTLTALATNLNGLGTNVATLVAGVNAVAADVGGLGLRIDAVAATQAGQEPLLAAAAAGDPAVADLAAAFAAYRDEATAGPGQLAPQQQQALAVSLAALNAQLAAIGFPMDAVPIGITGAPAAPATGTAAAAAPATGAAPAPATTAVAAPAAVAPAPVRENAFLAAPAAATPGATATTALPDGRQLIETAINADNLTMSERAFDLVTGTTYVWRITAGDSYAMRLNLPRFTEFAHVASVTVDGTLFTFPPLQQLDILEDSLIEIEFTPIRTQVLTFEFLPMFGATFTDMNMIGTLTFR